MVDGGDAASLAHPLDETERQAASSDVAEGEPGEL
jgi:hypothetical protein